MMKKMFLVCVIGILAACASDDAPQQNAEYRRVKAERDCKNAYANMSAGFERDSKISKCVRGRAGL